MQPTGKQTEEYYDAERKIVLMGKVHCSIDKDKYIGNGLSRSCSYDSRITKLEDDVAFFQQILQQEKSLNLVLESALSNRTRPSDSRPQIPLQVHELLSDVAILELAVLKLEEQILLLQIQINNELVQKHILEQRSNKLFVPKDETDPAHLSLSAFWVSHLEKDSPSNEGCLIQESAQQNLQYVDPKHLISLEEIKTTSKSVEHPSSESERGNIQLCSLKKHGVNLEQQFDSTESTVQRLVTFADSIEPSRVRSPIPVPPPSPGSPERLATKEASSSLQGCCNEALDFSASPKQWTFWRFPLNEQRGCNPPAPRSNPPSPSPSPPPPPPTPPPPQHGLLPSSQRQGWADIRRLSELYWKKLSTKPTSLFHSDSAAAAVSPLKTESSSYSPRISVEKQALAGNDIQHPCVISEDMVQCMIDIYCYLSDTSGDTKSSQLVNLPSPTSPLGNAASSSSSLSETSFLSLLKCPLVNLQNSERTLGSESTYDPYRTYEKVSWADIGVYNSAVEVLWISVGKEQLDFAAAALCKYKVYVEELSQADIKIMTNQEKLAFWINIYNALVMHAFLAYGIPKSEAKYFSMLQKATYFVGGHSFSAIAIEFGLLKGKVPAHRPQMALLLAFHRLKLSEEQTLYGIEHQEPRTIFALCSGSYSSPAVRVYTAERVLDQLQESVHDYIHASVGINLRGKLLVPKLLYLYARGIVDDAALVDWICQRLPASQSSLIQDCMQQRHTRLLMPRKFKVLPFDFRFRYLFLAVTGRKPYVDALLSPQSARKRHVE